MKRFVVVLLFLLVLLPACSIFESDSTGDVGTPSPATATPGPTPTTQTTPQPTEAVAEQQQEPIKIWVVETLSPVANVPGGSILAEQLAAYELNHPEVQIEVEVKSAAGRGGIVSYLRTGPNVARAVMPDLIALPAEQLAMAAGEGLLFPLDEVVDQAERADLYPAALTLGQQGGQLFGYPMTLSNLTHMVYSTDVFTRTVPATWDELIAPDLARFTFPGAGQPGAELLLQLYLAEGGTLTDESNQLALQLEPLTAALKRISDGRASGAIPVETSSLTTYAESWQTFGGAANAVQTVHQQYRSQRRDAVGDDFVTIPGPEEPLTPLVDGMAWAVSATDPARQVIAADILRWLIAGPNMGDWSLAAARLPARRTAFEQWPEGDQYTFFLQQQLEVAGPYPMIARGTMLDVLRTALFDVLSLASTPEAAAQAAVTALRP